MWQTDTVYLQTKVDTNVYGSISTVWTQSTAVLCDVQDISKEYAYKNYGLTNANNFKQIFDYNMATWVVGNQVKYNEKQWIVRLVNNSLGKIGATNHTFVIMSEVV
jgi:hypothetical protein